MSRARLFWGSACLAISFCIGLGALGCRPTQARAVPKYSDGVSMVCAVEAGTSCPGVVTGHATPSVSPRSTAEIFTHIARSSVRLRVQKGTKGGYGSGTLISVQGTHGLILTAAHVVEGESGVMVDFDREGRPLRSFPAIVEKVDSRRDLALVYVLGHLKEAGLAPAPIAQEDPQLYDELFVVAAPLGVLRQTAIERVNSMDGYAGDPPQPMWAVTGAVIPGMSGSGAFSRSGGLSCVLLLCAAMVSGPETSIGYCTPRSEVQSFLQGYSL